jgi:hypothetical protein
MNEKIIGAVVLTAIVIGSVGFGSLISVESFDTAQANLALTSNSTPAVTAMPTPAVANPVNLENETVQLEANVTLEIETTSEVITAEDIDFVVTQFYLEQPFLHLHAQTSIPRKTILLEIIEIGDSRNIDITKIPIITDTNGMIFLDNQWVRFRNGYAYKANLYYNNTKIASSTSGLVEQGKANFGFVTLTTQQPNQYSARIITQKYYDMRLYLDGETNIPEDQKIIGDMCRITNNIKSREVIGVNSFRYIEIKQNRHGEITLSSERRSSISVPIGEGHYKLTLKHKNTKDILCILGFQVVKEKISEDKNVFKGTHWVKNVYIPVMAI